MTGPSDQDRDVAAITAALLKQGRTLHISATAMAAVLALAALVHPSGFAFLATVLVLILFAAESYLAVRVGLDAGLFARFSEQIDRGDLDLKAFDQGLVASGLVQKSQSVRGLEERAAGARRLLKLQGAVVLLIFAAVGASAAGKWVAG